MIMTIKDSRQYMCPQSVSGNSKPFGCRGIKCAAFRVFTLTKNKTNDPLKSLSTFYCGMVARPDVDQATFQIESKAFWERVETTKEPTLDSKLRCGKVI